MNTDIGRRENVVEQSPPGEPHRELLAKEERMDIVFMSVDIIQWGTCSFERNVEEGGEEDMKREGYCHSPLVERESL